MLTCAPIKYHPSNTLRKVVRFIALANNNYIYVTRGEIKILFWTIQGKTLRALTGAWGSTLSGWTIHSIMGGDICRVADSYLLLKQWMLKL